MDDLPDRIHFPGNPWPEGHALTEFAWTARVVDGVVWCDLHLRSADYYAERDIELDEGGDEDLGSSWEARAAEAANARLTDFFQHFASFEMLIVRAGV